MIERNNDNLNINTKPLAGTGGLPESELLAFCVSSKEQTPFKRPARPAPKPIEKIAGDTQEIFPHKTTKNVKYVITPEIHNAIFQLYTNPEPDFKGFCKRYAIPQWRVSKYAINQGWIKKARPFANWSEPELRILERNAHFSPKTIKNKLKAAGYTRSEHSIVVKRKRMRFLQNLGGQSANSLAQCLGIGVHSVLYHIKNGNLKAERRDENKETPTYYIKDKDVKKFIVSHVDTIDFRKVDKYWLVDLLTASDIR